MGSNQRLAHELPLLKRVVVGENSVALLQGGFKINVVKIWKGAIGQFARFFFILIGGEPLFSFFNGSPPIRMKKACKLKNKITARPPPPGTCSIETTFVDET